MKNYKLKVILGIFITMIFSCSEEFLEESPSEFITSEQLADAAIVNPDVLAGTMTGIYSSMFATQTGGSTGHDDFGQKGYDIYMDMLSSDMALSVSTYGWYRSSITEYQGTTDYTFYDNTQVWTYYYFIIRSANTIIDALGGNDVIPEFDGNKYIMGQAKAIRAHSYFYLTQLYAKTYDPTEEILPFYDDTLDENGPKVTQEVIYDLILSDLTDALTLLDGFTRTSKSEINLEIAKGILAYVYGAMGNYDEVQTLTDEIINVGEYTIMTAAEVVGGFNDVNTSGWMWGVDLTIANDIGLVSWWGQIDYFSYSYAAYGDAKAIDASLYDEIADDDVRKGQFYNSPGSYLHLMPLDKFYDSNRTAAGASTTVTADLIYMRIAEIYLLNAEAAAYNGDESAARTSLKSVLDLRLDDTTYIDSLTGQDLIDEIYLQTRIELWGEGKSYLALKRNKASFTRGSNHLSFVGDTFNYNDEELTFEIPEEEILNNPFISDQNN